MNTFICHSGRQRQISLMICLQKLGGPDGGPSRSYVLMVLDAVIFNTVSRRLGGWTPS